MLQQLEYNAYVGREVLERCDSHYVSSIFLVLVLSSTVCQNQHRLRILRLIRNNAATYIYEFTGISFWKYNNFKKRLTLFSIFEYTHIN